VLAIVIVVFGSVTLARAEPDLVGKAVEAVRSVVGPAPVAAVENVMYEATDWLNRTRYQLTGSAPTWQWSDAPAGAAVSEQEAALADQVVLAPPVAPDAIPTPALLANDPSSATVAELRANGDRVRDDLLDHIAPLGWEHRDRLKVGVLCGATVKAGCRLGESDVVSFECSVHDGGSNLQHKVGSSWRPAHLLFCRHPSMQESMDGAFGGRR